MSGSAVTPSCSTHANPQRDQKTYRPLEKPTDMRRPGRDGWMCQGECSRVWEKVSGVARARAAGLTLGSPQGLAARLHGHQRLALFLLRSGLLPRVDLGRRERAQSAAAARGA